MIPLGVIGGAHVAPIVAGISDSFDGHTGGSNLVGTVTDTGGATWASYAGADYLSMGSSSLSSLQFSGGEVGGSDRAALLNVSASSIDVSLDFDINGDGAANATARLGASITYGSRGFLLLVSKSENRVKLYSPSVSLIGQAAYGAGDTGTVRLVYDGTTVSGYVNGGLVASSSAYSGRTGTLVALGVRSSGVIRLDNFVAI